MTLWEILQPAKVKAGCKISHNAICLSNYPLKIYGNILSLASQENKNTPAWTWKHYSYQI